jgi:hypothetical protein
MNTMLPPIIVRHSPPTKLDQAPYGTRCRVINNANKSDTKVDVYIQGCLDEDNPRWEMMAERDSLESALELIK